MNSQILRVAIAAVAAFAVSLPAQAATLTVDIPGCSALAMTGPGPNATYQVTCAQQVQSCVVNATPASPQGNTVAQLTVACINPAATAVTWQASRDCATPTVAPGNPLAATVTEPGGRTCVYTATAGGGGGSGSATVVWQGPGTQPPPNSPTGCAITRTPANGQLTNAGGPIGMSGACSGGGTVTAWNWRRNATSAWSTAAAPTDSLPANTGSSPVTYTYGLTACAGTACANEVVTTFTVAGSAPAGFCGAYPNVIIVDLPIDTGGGPIATAANGGFAADGVFVGRLVVPASVNQAGIGSVTFVEFVDPPAERLMTVSANPCDFRGGYGATDPTSATAPIKWSNGQTPQIQYQFTPSSSNAVLQAGQTYYFNFRNEAWYAPGPSSCAGTYCNGRITTRQP